VTVAQLVGWLQAQPQDAEVRTIGVGENSRPVSAVYSMRGTPDGVFVFVLNGGPDPEDNSN
jgi:hypothetical protein